MSRCSICRHAERAAIDASLIAGGTVRDVAGRWGVSKTAADRHRAHIAKPIAKAEAAYQRSVLERVRDMHARALKMLDQAEGAEPDSPAALLREAGRLLELEARITGELAPQKLETKIDVADPMTEEAKLDVAKAYVAAREAALRSVQ